MERRRRLAVLILLLLNGWSLGSVLDTSGSGDYCSLDQDCRPPMNRNLVTLSDLGLTSNCTLCWEPVSLLQIHSRVNSFKYIFEIDESPPLQDINELVLKINETSKGLTSFHVIHQIERFTLSFDEFACSEVELSFAWIGNDTLQSDFSSPITLCLSSGVPGPPIDLSYTVTGGRNCSKSVDLALINVMWKPPVNDGDLLSYYSVSIFPSSSSCQTTTVINVTLNKTSSSVIHEALFGCNYTVKVTSYPGGYYRQILVQVKLPSPKLYSSCSSIFNTESQLYNVTIEWRVTPNDCSVLGRITVFVLKMLPYETVFGLTSTLDTTQVQAEIKLDNTLPAVYQYTFSNLNPRRSGEGYTIETQTKFTTLDNISSWPSKLSNKECPALTPPLAPEQIDYVSVSNFTLWTSNRIASLNIEWSPPLPTNGDITEYQIWIWSNINQRIQTLTRINDIANYTLEQRVNFSLSSFYSSFNIQIRASNNWCLLEYTQCYSNWSRSIEILASTALIPTISSSGNIPSNPVDKASISPSLLWSMVGAIVALIVAIVILSMVTVCCCYYGGRCIKRDYAMSPFIDLSEPGMSNLLQFSNLNEDRWEIPRNLLEVYKDEKLGSGCFGEVIKGSLQMSYILNKKRLNSHHLHNQRRGSNGQSLPVAVKKLKNTADGKERSDFLKEIEIMKTVSSTDSDLKRFVVNMLGCCRTEEPILLVIEFVRYGDLLNYLRKMKRKTEVSKSQGLFLPVPYLEPAGTYSQLDPKSQFDDEGFLTERNLLDFSRQIASGMEYLSSLGIAHRDLACRNILVGDDRNLKISDFGLSRIILQDMVYTLTNHGRLPLRWMALESIFQREFTTSSDVWSYGVVLWEICTMGMFPYSTLQEKELLKLLKKGYRLPKPDNCSQDMFDVMHQCWHPHPNGRPQFSELHKLFDYFLSRHTQELYPYIDLDTTAPYTYDHLAHRDITNYQSEEEMINLEEEASNGAPYSESSGYGSTKDIGHEGNLSSDENKSSDNLVEESISQDEAILYDTLRVMDHPFLMRMCNSNCSTDTDYFCDDSEYIEEDFDDNCLHPFDMYRMKKLSTITEVSCEDYGEK